MTALIASVALAAFSPAHGNFKCHAECWQWRRCNNGSIAACIHRSALKWNVSHATMRRRAMCESRMNPRAYNRRSGASGLYQFLPSTWRTTPYRRRNIWSAKWSALAAGWMESVGRGGEWVCR